MDELDRYMQQNYPGPGGQRPTAPNPLEQAAAAAKLGRQLQRQLLKPTPTTDDPQPPAA